MAMSGFWGGGALYTFSSKAKILKRRKENNRCIFFSFSTINMSLFFFFLKSSASYC